jgi:hypothetical protein
MFRFLKVLFKEIYLINKIYTICHYFFLKNKISYQLDDSKINFSKPKKKTFFFLLIETSHTVNFLLMLFAKILQIKGYNVYALVCDQFLDACEIKSIRSLKNKNPCYSCKFNQNKVYPFFKIQIKKLSYFNNLKLEKKITKNLKKYEDNNFSFSVKDKLNYLNIPINDSVTRYYFGSHLEEKNQEKLSKLSLDHCKTALYMHEISRIIDNEYKPVAVVSTMASYSAWYPFFNYFKKDNRFRQIGFDTEICSFDPFKFFPSIKFFRRFTEFGKKKELNKKENIEINKYLKNRFNSQNFNSRINYNKYKKKYNQIQKILDLKKKINIFIFPNVFWDVGLSDRGAVFNTVLDWLFFTLEALKNNSKYHIYIKPHPAEFIVNNSLLGIEQLVKNKYGNSISNLSFIDNSNNFSSYDLKQFIDLALVFNGTLNLEFMLLNVPVISTGMTPTRDNSFIKEVKNIDEYKKILTNSCNFKNFLVKDKKKLKMFAYFWFIKKNLKFNKKNLYISSFTRFKGFNFKSLNSLNFNDIHHKTIINFILSGKQYF